MRQDKSKRKTTRQDRETLDKARTAAKRGQADEESTDGTEIAEQSAGPDAPASAEAASRDRSGRSRESDAGRAVNTSRVLDRLTDDRDTTERLRALQARQRRLPLDIDTTQEDSGSRTRTKQTRDELVERLLDPVLTLQETATLLDVCPTTVRRYTNRGVLNCFRTPGNQRRFRLSDVISFMEQRDTQ